MTTDHELDVAHLRSWIGRKDIAIRSKMSATVFRRVLSHNLLFLENYSLFGGEKFPVFASREFGQKGSEIIALVSL